MRRKTSFGLRLLPLLLAGLFAGGATTASSQSQPAREVAPVLLERMLLLLEPSAAQQNNLESFLVAQQASGSPNYHHWMTANEFADKFANSVEKTASVAEWLRGQGFAVAALPAGRGWIEFSGSRTQVERSFQTKLKLVGGRYRAVNEATIPAAIAPMVKGLISLDGSLAEPAVTPVVLLREASGAQTPAMAEKWLGLAALRADGANGAGEIIAIPTRSNVRLEDLAAFRKTFGLRDGPSVEVVLSGADPGRTAEESAAVLSASWAAVAAPEAQIVLVAAATTNATDGIELALAAAIDGELARTVSVGFSACEGAMSPAHLGFYGALYRQAAAEGIAVIAASGDSGAAGCHPAGDRKAVESGYGINGLASTPWNTAVGAIGFLENSAEVAVWGQRSLAEPAYATGGGASRVYATPEWQSASGLPASDPETVAGHHRYLPDVVIPAALDSQNRGLAFCYSGEVAYSGCRWMGGGGSAASTAIFAGVAALIAQKYGPQGNLAGTLYSLAGIEPLGRQVFRDIAQGKAVLRCVLGSPNCGESGEIGFNAGVGYDLATGLGAVDAGALVKDWGTSSASGTASVNVVMTLIGGATYNPTATIDLTAKVSSGSGGTVPTGTVQFFDQTSRQNAGSPVTLAADGTASYTEQAQFTIGGHNIQAIYNGDSTYQVAISQPITINIQPSPTTLVVVPSTTTPVSGGTITVTGTVTPSSNIHAGDSPPTGSLTVNLDGLAQGTPQRFTTTGTATTASVNVTLPSGGVHAVQGTYSGDINYSNSTSAAVTITAAKGATVILISATPGTLTSGLPETLTATIAPFGMPTTAYTITGSVSFYDGGTTLLGSALIGGNTAILAAVQLSASVAHTITAIYSGDTNWSPSTSGALILEPVLLPVTVTLTTSTAVLSPGQSASVTATVAPVNTPAITAEQHPTGHVFFFAGSTLIGEASLGIGIGDSAVATIVIPSLPAGAYVLTAQYAGDLTYGAAISNSLGFQVEDFTIISNVSNITMVQGTTAQVLFTVTSSGGLTGPIQVICTEQNPPTAGAIQCSFTPNIVNGTGDTTLTVVTTGGNISRNQPPPRPGDPLLPIAGGGIALAFVGMLLSPIGRRAGVLRGKIAVLVLLLVGLAGAGIGCSNSVTSVPSVGTPLGVHTLKITAAAYVNTVTVTHNAFLTVNVTP